MSKAIVDRLKSESGGALTLESALEFMTPADAAATLAALGIQNQTVVNFTPRLTNGALNDTVTYLKQFGVAVISKHSITYNIHLKIASKGTADSWLKLDGLPLLASALRNAVFTVGFFYPSVTAKHSFSGYSSAGVDEVILTATKSGDNNLTAGNLLFTDVVQYTEFMVSGTIAI